MGKRYSQRKVHTAKAGRPSLFFIIAIIVALILLTWMFVTLVGRPAEPVAPTTTASVIAA